MKIGIIGIGHVGLVTAACMAELGHDIVGMDDDAAKVESLRKGRVPFYEPGLPELFNRGVTAGRLVLTGDVEEAVAESEVVFLCVGTPRRDDGSPDLSYVQAASSAIARAASRSLVVAEKSTVPVRTGRRIRQTLQLEARAGAKGLSHEVVSNPEFLKEGTAIEDTLRPDRIVVGADSAEGHEVMRAVYQPLLDRHDCPYVATDVHTAELIKHASNAFLATKISFMNGVARICEIAGADVRTVADAMGHDRRIGRDFLNAGLGYGGSCFPKDVEAFIHIAGELGYNFGMLRETDKVNREAKQWPIVQLQRLLWNLAGHEIAVLGLAFKPGTDDIRDAPALDVVDSLLAQGATVRLHDPVALRHVRGRYPGVVTYDEVEDALRDAHAAVLCTEWPEYSRITPDRLRTLLRYPIVIDARGAWDPAALERAGLTVAAVGRQPSPTLPVEHLKSSYGLGSVNGHDLSNGHLATPSPVHAGNGRRQTVRRRRVRGTQR